MLKITDLYPRDGRIWGHVKHTAVKLVIKKESSVQTPDWAREGASGFTFLKGSGSRSQQAPARPEGALLGCVLRVLEARPDSRSSAPTPAETAHQGTLAPLPAHWWVQLSTSSACG